MYRGEVVLVVIPVERMTDENLMRHLESRHTADMEGARIRFTNEPDHPVRRLAAGAAWRAYHDAMHRLYPRRFEHSHEGQARG